MVCTAVYILVIHMARVCHTVEDMVEMASEDKLRYKSANGKPETFPLKDPIVDIALSVFHSLLVFSKEHYKHLPDFVEKYDIENFTKESRMVGWTRYIIVEDYKNVKGYMNIDEYDSNNYEVFGVEDSWKSDKTLGDYENKFSKDPIIKIPELNFSFSFPPKEDDFPNIYKQSGYFSAANEDQHFAEIPVNKNKKAPLTKRPKIQNEKIPIKHNSTFLGTKEVKSTK